MPTVTEDLANGYRITRQAWRNRINRVFYVSELVEPPEYQLMEALAQPEIPQWKELYPFSATPEYPAYESCRVVDQTAEVYGVNGARIVVVYDNDYGSLSSPTPATEPPQGSNEGAEIRNVSYGFREYETTVDRDGLPMILTPPLSHFTENPYRAIDDALATVGTINFERTERKDPTPNMRAFVRRVNSVALGPYAIGTVRFNGVTSSGNETDLFRCSYEFEWDEAGWDKQAFWRDNSGKVPDDGDPQLFNVLDEADFTSMGFDWSDL